MVVAGPAPQRGPDTRKGSTATEAFAPHDLEILIVLGGQIESRAAVSKRVTRRGDSARSATRRLSVTNAVTPFGPSTGYVMLVVAPPAIRAAVARRASKPRPADAPVPCRGQGRPYAHAGAVRNARSAEAGISARGDVQAFCYCPTGRRSRPLRSPASGRGDRRSERSRVPPPAGSAVRAPPPAAVRPRDRLTSA